MSEWTMTEPFWLSIEPINGPSRVHGFHLGTDERIARELAVEVFIGTMARTVALMRYGKLHDVYDGRDWHSDAMDKMYEEDSLNEGDL